MGNQIKALLGTFVLAMGFTWWGVKQAIEAYEDNGPMDFAADAIVPAAIFWLLFVGLVIKSRRDAARERAGQHWHDEPHRR